MLQRVDAGRDGIKNILSRINDEAHHLLSGKKRRRALPTTSRGDDKKKAETHNEAAAVSGFRPESGQPQAWPQKGDRSLGDALFLRGSGYQHDCTEGCESEFHQGERTHLTASPTSVRSRRVIPRRFEHLAGPAIP